jgi:hypothetical protein
LGVLTSKDVEQLSAQVAELADSVRALLSQENRVGTVRPAAQKGAVKKAVAKKATAKKAVVTNSAARKVARKK